MSWLTDLLGIGTGASVSNGMPGVSVFTPPSDLSPREAMGLSTVFACVDVISSGVAKLPLIPYVIKGAEKRPMDKEDIYYFLNFTPNPNQTRFDFLKTLLVNVLIDGNGYARIRRDELTGYGNRLEIWSSADVSIITDKAGTTIRGYYNARLDTEVPAGDMVHIRNFSEDGIKGVSVLTYARNTLRLNARADEEAGKYFDDGRGSFGILSTDSARLNKEQRDAIRKEWQNNFSSLGNGQSGLAVLEGGMKYQRVTINPADAQLLQTRQFSVSEICRFFNVSPVKVHDLSKSSYSTLEAVNLAFLTDTLSPYLTQIETELWRKIFPRNARKTHRIEFDTSAFQRGDSTAQAALLTSLFNNGAITSNEIRAKFNLPPIEGGDEAFIQVNMMRLNSPAQAEQEDNNSNEQARTRTKSNNRSSKRNA